MILFSIAAIIGTFLLAVGVGYLYFLALVGMSATKKKLSGRSAMNFLILIPAYNESKGIIDTLKSLKRLKKTDRTRIVVVADNCNDDTASIVRDQGVEVLERNDLQRRGKGYALEWAMSQYDLDDFDAVVIIDADTIVEENMLEIMAGLFSDGADAVQLCYLTDARKSRSVAYIQYIASLTENYLYYGPRQKLGLAILLRGTGMAVRSEVLKKYPWDSHSVTEDVDYALKLIRADHRIDFSLSSRVTAGSTESFGQSYSQKKRWISGTVSLILDNFVPLIKEGFAGGNFRLIELAFSLLLLSRPTLIYFAVMMIVISQLGLQTFQDILLIANLSLSAALVVYIFLGIFYCENKIRALLTIPLIPVYGIWYLFVQLGALINFRRAAWVRTKRDTDER